MVMPFRLRRKGTQEPPPLACLPAPVLYCGARVVRRRRRVYSYKRTHASTSHLPSHPIRTVASGSNVSPDASHPITSVSYWRRRRIQFQRNMDQAMSPSARPGGGGGIHWEAHGRLLTACLVGLNVFLVLLVYVYFWRFFSRSRGGGEDDDDVEGASSVASSPPASPKARDRREVQLAITALPVFVHSSSSSGVGPGAECAICIAEFADGDEGRLLPRCGHRFHARCVDTWFRFHTTCPLCRATVLADDATPPPVPAAAAQTANQPPHQHHTDTNSSHDDAETDYSPV